ncbi:hypothetical protein C8R42DRAFT_661081 [Lentinula raphanica]|nr:hypothetical protein C8R42DRAFT_661081 [Lentinula raphanica]
MLPPGSLGINLPDTQGGTCVSTTTFTKAIPERSHISLAAMRTLSPVTCVIPGLSGILSGTPTQAIISSTASPLQTRSTAMPITMASTSVV